MRIIGFIREKWNDARLRLGGQRRVRPGRGRTHAMSHELKLVPPVDGPPDGAFPGGLPDGMEAKPKLTATLSARIKKGDGTIVDLGVIDEQEIKQ